MLDSSVVELLAQLASELEPVLAVIAGLVCIAYGAAMIVNPRRYLPKLEKDAPQASRRRSASL